MNRRRLAHPALLLGAVLGACYGGQTATPGPQATPAKPTLARRAPNAPDDCAPEAGQQAPQPLRIPYSGVAKAARCEREVYTIMGGITHFLGVECRHCHLEPDYTADTHNKQVANWMARELVPRLQQRAPSDSSQPKGVWCQDCHAGKAKFLGNPRQRGFAIEWMTTHLVEDFETTQGKPPKCKDCHGGDLGSPEFRAKIILGDLSGLPAPAAPPSPSAPPVASAVPAASAAPAPAPAPASSSGGVPDFGER